MGVISFHDYFGDYENKFWTLDKTRKRKYSRRAQFIWSCRLLFHVSA